jgi:hypothetical protein
VHPLTCRLDFKTCQATTCKLNLAYRVFICLRVRSLWINAVRALVGPPPGGDSLVYAAAMEMCLCTCFATLHERYHFGVPLEI